MFTRQRKKNYILKYQKYFLRFCLFVICTIILYLLLTSQRLAILQSIQIHSKLLLFSYTNFYLTSDTNKNEKQISNINSNFSQSLFQSHLSPYHPRLPIHTYTQNLTSLRGPAKLILLGNAFFGDEKWGLGPIDKSSRELMNQLLCPYLVDYCDITIDQSFFSDADAVVYHGRDDINLKQAKKNRHPNQRFVFAVWESPAYTSDLKSFKGFFNWTMTYRFDSHIVASYYSTVGYIHTSSSYYQFLIKENATKNLNLNFERVGHRLSDGMLVNKKLGTVAALISNCGGYSRREFFIKHLKRYIDVKVYGRCGEECPKNVDCREFIAKNYYFFLSFENSLCTDYTTEKFFVTLKLPIVPVVFGRTNYSYFIPSSGFIDFKDFTTLSSLAQYLNETRYNKEKYLSYFIWKKDYVWSVSQFFTPFCDLCLRLHLDSKPNVIDDIDTWWHDNACQGPTGFLDRSNTFRNFIGSLFQ